MNFKARSHNMKLIPLYFQINGENVTEQGLKILLFIYIVFNYLLDFKIHIIFTIKFFIEVLHLFLSSCICNTYLLIDKNVLYLHNSSKYSSFSFLILCKPSIIWISWCIGKLMSILVARISESSNNILKELFVLTSLNSAC